MSRVWAAMSVVESVCQEIKERRWNRQPTNAMVSDVNANFSFLFFFKFLS